MKQKAEEVAAGPGSLDNRVLLWFEHALYVTNSLGKLLRKTGLLFRWLLKHRARKMQLEACPRLERQAVLLLWVRAASPATLQAMKQEQLKDLTPLQHKSCKDVLVVQGRAMQGLKKFFHQDSLLILMHESRTAFLILLWAHEQDHDDGHSEGMGTLGQSEEGVWPGGSRQAVYAVGSWKSCWRDRRWQSCL